MKVFTPSQLFNQKGQSIWFLDTLPLDPLKAENKSGLKNQRQKADYDKQTDNKNNTYDTA